MEKNVSEFRRKIDKNIRSISSHPTEQYRALVNTLGECTEKFSDDISSNTEKLTKTISDFNKSTTALTVIIIFLNSILAFSACVNIFSTRDNSIQIWVSIVVFLVVSAIGLITVLAVRKNKFRI